MGAKENWHRFMPYIKLNGKQVVCTKFSGGECNVNISEAKVNIGHNVIKSHIKSSDDLIFMILTVDAVRRIAPNSKIRLVCPYLPYARQDRVCNYGEAFSLEVVANIINSMNFHCVEIWDPHSDVALELIHNSLPNFQYEFVKNSGLGQLINNKGLTIISPDKGSREKVEPLEKIYEMSVVYCEKIRNHLDGSIDKVSVGGDVNGKDLIIIDDICDGGRTFIALSEELKKNGARDIYLYVTHGIFSNGFDSLRENIKHIFVYIPFNSIEETDFVTVLGEF